MWRGSRAASAPESVPQSPSRLSLPFGLIEALDFSSSRESDGPTTWPDVLHLHFDRRSKRLKDCRVVRERGVSGAGPAALRAAPGSTMPHAASGSGSLGCALSVGDIVTVAREEATALGPWSPKDELPLTAPKGERVEPATRHRMVVVPPFNLYRARRPAPGWAGL